MRFGICYSHSSIHLYEKAFKQALLNIIMHAALFYHLSEIFQDYNWYKRLGLSSILTIGKYFSSFLALLDDKLINLLCIILVHHYTLMDLNNSYHAAAKIFIMLAEVRSNIVDSIFTSFGH